MLIRDHVLTRDPPILLSALQYEDVVTLAAIIQSRHGDVGLEDSIPTIGACHEMLLPATRLKTSTMTGNSSQARSSEISSDCLDDSHSATTAEQIAATTNLIAVPDIWMCGSHIMSERCEWRPGTP